MVTHVQVQGSDGPAAADRIAAIQALRDLGFPEYRISLHLAFDLGSTNRHLLEIGLIELLTELMYSLACVIDDDELVELVGFYDDVVRQIGMITPTNVETFFADNAQLFECQGRTNFEVLLLEAFKESLANVRHKQCPTVYMVLSDGLDETELTGSLVRRLQDCTTTPTYFIIVGHAGQPGGELLRQLDILGAQRPDLPDIVHYVELPPGHVKLTAKLAVDVFRDMLPWLEQIKQQGLYE